MKTIHLKRPAVLVGLAGVALGAVLLVPGAAAAQVPNPPVGQFAGGLTLNPASGDGSEVPSFTAAHACPAGTVNATVVVIDLGGAEQGFSNPVDGAAATTPGFQGVLGFSMSLAPLVAGSALPESFEFVVDCHAQAGVPGTLTDYLVVNFTADGSWNTGTSTGPVSTTTSLTGPSSPVQVGGNVTLNATVAPASAAGTVQFKDNGANLGSPVAVAGGAAQFSTTTLAAGSHPVTAQFVPADATAFSGSTSNPVTVTVTNPGGGGNVGMETINVNVPHAEGVFVMTVSSTPVQMADAVLSADSTTFESTGSLGAVTVSDGRNQTKPGWTISGQVGDFTNGSATIDGNGLGWTPKITTPNAAADVVAGPVVAAGANPGLKQGSGLASAAASKGVGTTVLGADLDLKVPASTPAGAYSATLTITAMTTA
jgi:Bacterial Ig-like domain (group 3)